MSNRAIHIEIIYPKENNSNCYISLEKCFEIWKESIKENFKNDLFWEIEKVIADEEDLVFDSYIDFRDIFSYHRDLQWAKNYLFHRIIGELHFLIIYESGDIKGAKIENGTLEYYKVNISLGEKI